MSARGPRGGRGRGRGRGNGRGRGGGGKVTTWEWHNNYTPGPEVYEQLWHIRKEPAVVTPFLPTECPIRNAQTRILDRRQTEGVIQRNFYVVEVIYHPARNGSVSSVDDAGTSRTKTMHVDLSRILEYVSPDQLEQFENEQFRVEAEAEAVAMRIEAEELARRRLEKNAREPGMGRGSRMFSGLGLEAQGRARGRPRGRGRGRGRGSWRGRGALLTDTQLHGNDSRDVLIDAELDNARRRAGEDKQLVIAETDSDEDELAAVSRAQTQTTIGRSAFVTNSALPISPVQAHRRLSAIPIIQQAYPEAFEDTQSDPEINDVDDRSISTTAMQLRIDDNNPKRSDDSSDTRSLRAGRHKSKRQRTESTASMQCLRPTMNAFLSGRQGEHLNAAPYFSDSSAGSDASENSTLAQLQTAVHRGVQSCSADGTEFDNVSVKPPVAEPSVEQQSEDEDANTEEYTVEAIIEHYCDAGKTFYLVKWEGYKDSHDWLPEEDLEGAAELVAEYIAKVRRRKGKQKTNQ